MARSRVTLLASVTEVEQDIMEQVAREIGTSELCVGALGRYGFSGAQLFKCHCQGGRVFVVKVHVPKEIVTVHPSATVAGGSGGR